MHFDDSESSAMPGYVEVPMGESCRTVELSRELSLLIFHLDRTQPPPSRKILQQRIKNNLKSRFEFPDGSAIKTLFRLARLASRIECAGMDWQVIQRRDHGTLSWDRTLDWYYDRCGADAPSQAPRAQSSVPEWRQHLRQQDYRPTERYQQYKALRRFVYEKTEPGASERGVPTARYRDLRRYLQSLLESPDIDRVVSMLAQYVLALVGQDERTSVSYAYNKLTGFGRRLIHLLGDRNIEDLNDFALTELYCDVIRFSDPGYRASIASSLRAFHELHAASLSQVDGARAFRFARGDFKTDVSAHVLTDAEYRAARRIMNQTQAEGLLSGAALADRDIQLTVLHERGCRTGELTHSDARDVYRVEGSVILYARYSSLGTIKTDAARRPIKLQEHVLGRACPDAGRSVYQHFSRLADLNERTPVVVPGNEPRDLELLLIDLQENVRNVSGQKDIGLHATRHSTASRSWAQIMSTPEPGRDPHLRVAAVGAELGHEVPGTTRGPYVNVRHLEALPLNPVPLSSGQIQILTGEAATAYRKRKARSTFSMEGLLIPWADRLPPSREFGAPKSNWRGSAGDPFRLARESVRLLGHLQSGKSLAEARNQVALSTEELQRIFLELLELLHEHDLSIVPPARHQDLVSLGIDWALPKRRCRTVELRPIAAKAILNFEPTQSLSAEQALECVLALRRRRDRRHARHQAMLDSIQDTLPQDRLEHRDLQAIDDMLLVVAATLRSVAKVAGQAPKRYPIRPG